MRSPLISVIMPVYNGGLYLPKAIESILNQTFQDFEFIIINDGSTDGSLEMIEKYKNMDSRIVLINRENRGLLASLNEGIEKAKGQYIARMDADDISMPLRFEQQLKIMEEENADICGSHYLIINTSDKLLDMITTPLKKHSLLIYLALSVPFAHGSVMIRTQFLKKNSLFYGQTNFIHAEDKAMWIAMYHLNAKFVNVDNILFKYRDFNQSISKIKAREVKSDANTLRIQFLKKYEDRAIEATRYLFENFESLSYREVEYLGEISLFLFVRLKSCLFFKIFHKLSSRQKIILIFKSVSQLFSSLFSRK